jgi:hypothetical protein
MATFEELRGGVGPAQEGQTLAHDGGGEHFPMLRNE